MPLERTSQGFLDISASFKFNPLNQDLIALKNENSIARSVRNLVLTYPGEKFFNQTFGSRISKSLFENIDNISALAIRDEIINVIENYEPRVKLIEVKVNPNFDENNFDVTVIYRIVGIDVLPQQLTFALESTR